MKYTDLSINLGFHRNMRETNWLKLFPHWWSENDPLLETIGAEVERIKAQAVFDLLNIGLKPPVLLWQTSINHEKFNTVEEVTDLPHVIEIEAPLYKTWGKITIKNQSNTELYDLKIMITDKDGIIVYDAFSPEDKLVIDLTEQIFYINNKKIKPQIIGDGIPYFKTVQNVEITKELEKKWDPEIPLHNEIVRISFETTTAYNSMNLAVDVEMQNAVFINEQNIEITSLELIPLDKVELYVYYDFPFNEGATGWKKIGAKKYEPETRVIYDMITIQHYTRKFYAKVWFKGLDYPYKVGFPCWKDEDEDSIYHVNPRLDVWGEYLGLSRRTYKENIPEEEYYKTFPRFYEFDIEQDFWYYSRLVNEYAWNDLAINEVNLLDTNEDPILRLHSIDPFVQDFAVHARSHYPEEVEGVNFLTFIPSKVTQNSSEADYKQTNFENTFNLLKDNDYPTHTTLHNKADYAINNETYRSKELDMFFDLSALPENVNIDGFEIIIDAEATDNNESKYNDERTRLQIIDKNTCLYEQNIEESNTYELERKNIIYGASDRLFGMETVASNMQKVINQHAIIKENFQGTLGSEARIPFELIEDIDIHDVKIKYPSGKICDGIFEDGIIKTILPDTHEIGKEYYFADIVLMTKEEGQELIGLEIKNAILNGKYEVTLYHHNTNTDDENNDVKTVYIQNNKGTITFSPIQNDIIAITIENNEYCILYLLEDGIVQKSYKYNKKDSLEVMISSMFGSSSFLIPYEIFVREHRYNSYSIGISKTGEEILYNRSNYNLRDILQKNGVHFIFALENEDEINTPTIYVYNAYFRVYFSPKKTNFKLETRIEKGTDQFTDVGKLFVKITNIGDKPLQTICNILPENNIKLSTNSILVDLEVDEYQETRIDIEHQLPIIDGVYEIITICENQKKMNYINVRSNGLIETSIDLPIYSTHYHQKIPLIAEVKSIDNNTIDQGIISYYINGIKIGEGEVHDGQASFGFRPSDHGIRGGMYTLEARYTDYQYENNYIPKYASSRSINDLLISNQPTFIEILSDDYGFAKGQYTLKAKVSTYSGDHNISEGTISFYIDDELIYDDNKLGSFEVVNNIVEVDKIFSGKKAGIYTLKAVYDGTNQFGRSEITKEIILYGGATEVLTSDVYTYPGETVTFKAHVQQVINSAMSGAYSLPVVPQTYYALYSQPNGETPNANKITFYIDGVKIGKVDFNSDGNASIKYTIPLDILDNLDEKTCTLRVYYEGLIVYQTEEDYRKNKTTTYFDESYAEAQVIIIKKDTEIVCADIFAGSNYETLGFYVKVQEFGSTVPVKEGTVKITIPEIPKINDLLEPQEIEQDGGVRFVVHPIDFFDREWSFLEKTRFEYKKIPEITESEKIEYEELGHLFRIYDGESELDLLRNDFNLTPDFHLRYYIRKEETGDIEVAKDIKQVYIYGDHLYAQTDSDEITDSITYAPDHTTVKVKVEYIPTQRYKSSNKESQLEITSPQYDVDLHAYEFDFTSEDPIRAWVTNYEWDKDGNDKYDGKVYFYLDDVYLGKSTISENMAVIPHDTLSDIGANSHLLCAEYIPTGKKMAHTYAYNILTLRKANSSINAHFDYVLKDYDTFLRIKVTPNTQSLDYGFLYGNLVIYLNDKIYDKKILRGTLDNGEYNCRFHIPADIDEKDYIVKIEYEGNDFINPSSWQEKLELQQLPVNIITKDVYGIPNSTVTANIEISAQNKNDISEGSIILLDSQNNTVASAKVKHNKAKVKIDIGDVNTNQEYYVKYVDGINYKNDNSKIFIQKVVLISPLRQSHVSSNYDDSVVASDGSYEHPFTNLQEAFNCTEENGQIYIIDECILTETIDIDRDITIDGYNNSKIIKDLPDLFLDENYSNSLKVYSPGDFDKEIFKIDDLTLSNLNTKEFKIIENELYYIQDDNLIHIYLLNDGYFYSFTPLSGQGMNEVIHLNIKANVHFNNVEFISKDSDKDFIITNKKSIKITHSIINKNIIIDSTDKEITINYSLVYGDIRGSGDFSFNWWGNNDAPYSDNIILKMKTDIYPPVIGEDFYVEAELVGKNGKRYNIPAPKYELISNCEGYFQDPTGFMLDQYIKTLYADAIKQGEVTIKVDDQELSMPVYDYDYKTEVILDDATKIPINYQVPLRAKVQSCADTYYKFDEYNNIIQGSNDINEGSITFYIDDIQVGKAPVINGKAEILVFFDNTKYTINREYNFVAKYYDEENRHFKSENSKTITLFSENNSCFVSTDGNNRNDGTFKYPVRTIQQALSFEHVNNIYIKEGVYSDNSVIIGKDVNIIKYNGDVSFTYDDPNSILFNISDNKNVELIGLNFLNNNCQYIINNLGNLKIKQCVFNKNICEKDINSNSTAKNYIYDSVILDPNFINGIYITDMKYCWFGTNTPDGLIDNYDINDYIKMEFTSNKDIIYIGTIAHLKASLLKYVHNNVTFDYEGNLPLRIAMFESDSGSLMPLKDYTHNNYAISLFNTNEDSNSKQIFIQYEDIENYVDEPIHLKCSVTYSNGKAINDGKVIFNIYNKKEFYTYYANVNDSIAEIVIDDLALTKGEYPIVCSYTKDNQKYITESTLRVNHKSIIIEDIDFTNIDLNHLNINASNIVDSIGDIIKNQKIFIYIDDTIAYSQNGIKTFKIINGSINEKILYPMKKAGYHTIKITTKGIDNEYEELNYERVLEFTKKQTNIDFPYDKVQQDYQSDLIFNIYDDDHNIVIYGSVDVYLNNEVIYEGILVRNGQAILKNFVIHEKGRHSISIHYHGDPEYYEDSLYINNNINVGLYEVFIDEEDIKKQLKINIVDDLNISFYIFNVLKDKIHQGHVKLYIDDIPLNEDEYIEFEDELIIYKGKVPQGMTPGEHVFTIAYEDTKNEYMYTTFDILFTVTKIETEIIIEDIVTAPNKTINVDYDIGTKIGSALTGTLVAYLDDNIIGQINVTTDIQHKIPINIPLIKESKTIIFEYYDNTGYYQDNQTSVLLTISKESVVIETSYLWYYPNKDFDFTVTVKDKDGKIINDGDITLYIDSIKQTTSQPLVNGQINFILNFNKIKKYTMRILFSNNDYYSDTTYTQYFNIKKIPIYDISFENPLETKPNVKFNNTLIFNSFENYNITDGVVDFYLNNEKINTYYMTATNKNIRLDIPDLNAGTYYLNLKYYDSDLFDDFEKTYDFQINLMDVDMHMDNINARLNDTIDIDCKITPDVKGLVKYYIGVDENNLQFIGLKQANEVYEYVLSKDTLQESNRYIIVAHFDGNDKYSENETQCTLTIQKEDGALELNIEPEVIYNSYMDIRGTTNIEGNPAINLYLISENKIEKYINTVFAENGEFEYTYKLPAEAFCGNYTIMAEYEESPVVNYTSVENDFRIIQDTPTLKQTSIKVHKGNFIELENILYDTNGINIKSGVLEYTYNNEKILTLNELNNKYLLDLDPDWSKDTDTLKVTYRPPSSDSITPRYSSETYTIDLIYLKNDIEITIDMEEPPLRGENFNVNVHAKSYTTPLPVDINASYRINRKTNFTIRDGYGNINPSIPNTFTTDECKITISTEENDIFKPTDIDIDILISFLKTVYVSQNGNTLATGKEDDPVKTIEIAYNLLNRKGTIILLSNLSKSAITSSNIDAHTINIEKDITIDGKDKKLTNFIFNNEDRFKVINTHFDTSRINNKNILNIDNCKFKNNSSNIITDNEFIIKNSVFENNSTNGSGPCISVQGHNQYTLIDSCTFNNNSAKGKGGCIESNQGNDLIIQNSIFTNNSSEYLGGSCISINGNANINHNLFMKNTGTSDILLLTGFIESEINVFDGKIMPIKNNTGKVIANMTYWGQNNKNVAINALNSSVYTNKITADTWLLSNYKKESILRNGQKINKIYPVINQYANEDEYGLSDITDVIPSLIIEYNNNEYEINKDYIETTQAISFKIGQETIEVNND